jgi:hypothetical protein
VTTSGRVRSPFLIGGLSLTIIAAFDFSDGFVTGLTAAFPSDVEPFFDIERQEFNDDYDNPVDDSAEGGSAISQPPADETAPTLPERTVKAYIVKYTAYRTFVGDR